MNGKKPNGYWTEERIWAFAAQFKTRSDFRKNGHGVACRAVDLGIFDAIAEKLFKKVKNSWKTEADVYAKAKHYEFLGDFRRDYKGGLAAAKKNNWTGAIGHLKRRASSAIKFGYVIEFPAKKEFYAGITNNLKIRKGVHTNINSNGKCRSHNSAVKEYMELCEDFNWVEFTKPLNVRNGEAARFEKKIIADYTSKRWTPLNKAKAGALGFGVKKLNRNTVIEAALKCETYYDFYRHHSPSYKFAKANGSLMDEIWKMRPSWVKYRNKWNEKTLAEEALKYSSRSQFENEAGGAYGAATKLGILDKVCSHMKRKHRRWTKESTFEAAKSCKNISQFERKYHGAYAAAARPENLWLDEIRSVFVKKAD